MARRKAKRAQRTNGGRRYRASRRWQRRAQRLSALGFSGKQCCRLQRSKRVREHSLLTCGRRSRSMRARQRHTLASKQHSRTSSLRGRAQLGQLAGLRKQAPSCSWVRKAAAHRRRPTMHSRRRSISASLAPPMVPLETSQPNTLKPLGLRQGQRLLQPALTSQGSTQRSQLP